MTPTEIFENLRKAIKEYDNELAMNSAKKAFEEGIDPIEVLDTITVAIRDVGDKFGKGELWLTDLIGAADAMSSAMPIIDEEIRRRGSKRESLGTVVVGTVQGDIHNIGKTMVSALVSAEGFEVHDLGVDVKAEDFLDAVRKFSPDILAMSALMTTTSSEQRKVIEMLKKEGLRSKVKIMVGGGAITEDFANNIGADGYDPTAVGAAKLARNLVRK